MLYVIDSSSVIDLKDRYPSDVRSFEGIWTNLSTMAAGGSLIAPREVLLELQRGSDAAAAWAEGHGGMFHDICPEQAATMGEIWKRVPRLDREKSGPHADPWVVALAVREQKRISPVCVITQESTRGRTRIPAICHAFEVPSVKLLEFFKFEGW